MPVPVPWPAAVTAWCTQFPHLKNSPLRSSCDVSSICAARKSGEHINSPTKPGHLQPRVVRTNQHASIHLWPSITFAAKLMITPTPIPGPAPTGGPADGRGRPPLHSTRLQHCCVSNVGSKHAHNPQARLCQHGAQQQPGMRHRTHQSNWRV